MSGVRPAVLAASILLAVLGAARTARADAPPPADPGPSDARPVDPAISVRARAVPERIGPGESGVLALDIDVPAGWHLWSLDPGEGPQALALELAGATGFALTGPWHGPQPHKVFDRGFERELAQYGGAAGATTLHFERALAVDAGATPGPRTAQVVVRGQICTDETCLGQRLRAELQLEIVAEKTGLVAATPAGEVLASAGSSASPPIAGAGMGAASGSLLEFLIAAFLAGLAALATPCVFPAIPLTVSFFSKYSDERFGRGALLAGFYALSMVACFTLAGVALSVFLGASGVQQFASHPVFNVILALVLVFFSLNLLGMFEIQAPPFLLELTNKLESKWGPAARGGKKGGLADFLAVGVAAVTATTVFFTCTVAFVGVVVVAAADGEWFWPTIGMLAFASAFVLPFFLLALFPQAARRLRGKSGNWLVVTRVTLGFIELAAAIKFFSNADLVWKTNILTRDAALALWVSLFALCGLFLLGKLRLGEDHADGEIHISVPRMLISALTFAFTLFLALGLFTGRSLGWIDGWLPPVTFVGETAVARTGGTGGRASAPSFAWIHDLEEGRARAAETGQLVFVNYTGFTCTNCRYMEGSVFPRPEIASILETMVLVELYTDGLEPQHEKARDDQVKRFRTAALPFYAVERADGTVIATFPSSTNDPEEFRRFLADARAQAGPSKPAAAVAARAAAGSVGPDAPAAAPADAPLRLATEALAGGRPAPAIAPGKWTLLNFWATWCGPCRTELQGFLADVGNALEAKGGRFAAITVDEPDARAEALVFMRKIGVPDPSALQLGMPFDATTVDARLGFDGSQLPYTVLIAPDGRVAWRHNEALDKKQLEAILAEHMGYAALR